MADEVSPVHGLAAQGPQVGRVLLAVDQRHAAGPAEGHQRRQRDLGRVAAAAEHRLAKNRVTQSHKVKTGHQLTVSPNFGTVGVPGTVRMLATREPVLAFERELEGKRLLCVFNIGAQSARFTPPGSGEATASGPSPASPRATAWTSR